MKSITILLLSLLSLSTAVGASVLQHQLDVDTRLEEFSLKDNLMLQGYDVVSYQQADGPQQGSASHQIEYRGVQYRFVSDANQRAFLADPERYEPLYGGWCAYAMLEGKKTKANPESYKIVDDQLLVFYDGFWGDTLKMWNDFLNKETTDADLIETADSHWEEILQP